MRGTTVRRRLNHKIKRIEENLSAVARNPEVVFLMQGEDADQAKRQHYRGNIPDKTRLLVVTFKGYAIAGQGDVSEF